MENSPTPPSLPNLNNETIPPELPRVTKLTNTQSTERKGLDHYLKQGYNTTHEILFKNFSLRLWLKIAILGLICGASWSVLLSPLPTPWNWEENFYTLGTTEYQREQESQEDHTACAESDYCVVTGEKKTTTNEASDDNPISKLENTTNTILGIIILSIIGLFLAVIGIMFLWISSQSYFVFLSLIGNKKLEVIKSFKEYKSQANSVFLWGFLFIAMYAVPIGALTWGLCVAEGGSYGLVAIIFGLIGLLALTILMLLIADLCLPIMAIKKVGLAKAMTIAIKSIINAPLRFLLYLPIAIVIGLFIAAAFYIACIPVLFFTYFAGYAILTPLGLVLGDGPLYIVLSLLISAGILIPTSMAVLLLTVTPIVYYRAFSLHYLEYINPELTWEKS